MQQRPTCPACGGDPQRGRKKGEPACGVCHGGMAESPLGKQAMAQAAKAGTQKVKQAVAQRQQMAARQQMQQRAIAGGARPGMGPQAGPPQGAPMGGPGGAGRPQVDPRMLALLAARMRGGR